MSREIQLIREINTLKDLLVHKKKELDKLLDISIHEKENGLKKIMEVVCYVYGVSDEKVKSKSRERELTNARHVFLYVANQITSVSRRQLGLYVNLKQSLSIDRAINKIKDSRTIYKNLDKEIKIIFEILNS